MKYAAERRQTWNGHVKTCHHTQFWIHSSFSLSSCVSIFIVIGIVVVVDVAIDEKDTPLTPLKTTSYQFKN